MSTPARNSLGRFVASRGGAARTLPSAGRLGASVGVGGRGAKLDARVWTQRLREYVKRSGKSIPVALNKAGRSACFRAIRKTPKTKLAQITADVGTQANPKPEAFGLYQSQHRGLKGSGLAGLKQKVIRMIAAKRASIAYIAAGFFRALRAFSNTSKDVTPQSIAARGYGKKARPDQKFSEIFNAAPGADEMASGPLAEAAVEALDDMMDYLDRQQKVGASNFNR